MPTQPRSPSEHYIESERLVELAERVAAVTEDSGPGIALLAVCHALLAQAPRRARRRAHPGHDAANGLPPHLSWGDE